jgi:hypothetical protein
VFLVDSDKDESYGALTPALISGNISLRNFRCIRIGRIGICPEIDFHTLRLIYTSGLMLRFEFAFLQSFLVQSDQKIGGKIAQIVEKKAKTVAKLKKCQNLCIKA